MAARPWIALLVLGSLAAVVPCVRAARSVAERSTPLDPAGGDEAALAARRFLERHGGEWQFLSDPRTGRVVFAQGSGIELPAALRSASADALGATEPWVRGFLEAQHALLGPERGVLVLDERRSLVREAGKRISLVYAWQVDGVPVEGALVFARIRSGRLTQFGARGLAPVAIEADPRIGAAAAADRLRSHARRDAEPRWRGDPALRFVALEGPRGEIVHRLAWKLRYALDGSLASWVAAVDASTGEILGVEDENRYGTAVGGVYPRSATEGPEVRAPLAALALRTGRLTRVTDAAGRFDWTGGSLEAVLSGPWATVDCVGCSVPAQARVSRAFGSGLLDFGTGGTDGVGNGASTSAERNAFYHLNRIREVARGWLPEVEWLARAQLPIEVNLPYVCNAYWDGTAVHFFRAGGGCANTGELSDALHHEWAHALDAVTLLDDKATAEGTADVAALHLSHDPRFAPGWFVDGTSLRDLDRHTSPLGTLTLSAVQAGACERETGGSSYHCVGQLYGQAAWDLSQALVARYGAFSGWRESERLFFEAFPDAANLDPQSSLSLYGAYLQADDDDGNLANGTPHAAEIHDAFAIHGIAGPPVPASQACARPAAVALRVAAADGRFDLAWEPVPGAASYDVLRAELVEETAFVRVARLGAGSTMHADREVLDGVDYFYAVLAVDATGCESLVERALPARLPERPVLDLTRAEVAGSEVGGLELGAWTPIELTLANRGAAARGVRARLTTEKRGVTVSAGPANWPDLPAGAEARNATALAIHLDAASVACGDRIWFGLTPRAAGVRAVEDSRFALVVGRPDGRGGYVCGAPPAGQFLRSSTGCAARPRMRMFSASTNTEKAIAK